LGLPNNGEESLLERYAGIESGQGCERLAPALSAFVDGEADAAQMVALRAHLRQCLACRARPSPSAMSRSSSPDLAAVRPEGRPNRWRWAP
jgi:anti-sigma factor RsiW